MMMENHRNILLGSSVTICFHLQYHTVRGEGTSDKHLRWNIIYQFLGVLDGIFLSVNITFYSIQFYDILVKVECFSSSKNIRQFLKIRRRW
mmetsp:Transcript_41722/g.97703  ORF Transcript_41722/g.97703 Transcript_41722/m.97703 type:complete len:91 (+) Transcript_41722:606-878(+)